MEKILTIKSNAIFTRMYKKGKSSPQSTVVVYCRKNPSLKKAEIGITTSKKLGGAVERNRARRIIREAYRNLILENSGVSDRPYYFIFVARSKCFSKKTRMQDVKRDMTLAFDDLHIFDE